MFAPSRWKVTLTYPRLLFDGYTLRIDGRWPMKQIIKRWYEGEYVPHENDPGSPVVFLNGGHYRRHWTARFARWAIDFYIREWKWTLGTIGAVIAFLFFRNH